MRGREALESISRAFARLLLATACVVFLFALAGYFWYLLSYDGRMIACKRDVSAYYATMPSNMDWQERQNLARKYCAKQLAMRWENGSE